MFGLVQTIQQWIEGWLKNEIGTYVYFLHSIQNGYRALFRHVKQPGHETHQSQFSVEVKNGA
jgi:hypothetical protein